ncbi:hypothetical protein C8R48DRAFT_669292 [Suillus tomentosus]|nr:hypothetical protein C8R48DRAFT_669292 [Suillus tomentosus]
MPPLPVHEQPATHLAKAINKFTEAIPYDKLLIDATMHLNHRIQNKDTTNIPDLHLTVTAQPQEDLESDEIAVAKSISKNCMIRKLSITCDGHRDIDYAFVVSFEERVKWQQPKEDNIIAQQLHTAPALDYEDFIPSCIKKNLRFGPVEIRSHTWIDIREIRYSVHKRGMDGHFDFNNKNAATFAEGTLYPVLQLDNIERMLDDAAENLKEYIVSLMEGMGLEQSAVQSARDSRPDSTPLGGAAANSISSAIYLTAYCCYLDWRNHKYEKRKMMHINVQSSASDSSAQLTNASLLSIPATSSSSDPTTCPSHDATQTASSSAGLLLDVQPEPSAKKLKIQSEDRREDSTKAKPNQAGANESSKGKRKRKRQLEASSSTSLVLLFEFVVRVELISFIFIHDWVLCHITFEITHSGVGVTRAQLATGPSLTRGTLPNQTPSHESQTHYPTRAIIQGMCSTTLPSGPVVPSKPISGSLSELSQASLSTDVEPVMTSASSSTKSHPSTIHYTLVSFSMTSQVEHSTMSTTGIPTTTQNMNHIGTPRAIGALRNRRSPALLRHLGTPNVTHSTTRGGFNVMMNRVPSPAFPIKMEPNSDYEESDNESANSNDTPGQASEEFKAQLVLNTTRAQRDVCLVEKTLADCILKKNVALGKLYKFKATEAERKLEDTDIDIGYVRHSVRKIGIALLEDKPSRKHRRKSICQDDGDAFSLELDLAQPSPAGNCILLNLFDRFY